MTVTLSRLFPAGTTGVNPLPLDNPSFPHSSPGYWSLKGVWQLGKGPVGGTVGRDPNLQSNSPWSTARNPPPAPWAYSPMIALSRAGGRRVR